MHWHFQPKKLLEHRWLRHDLWRSPNLQIRKKCITCYKAFWFDSNMIWCLIALWICNNVYRVKLTYFIISFFLSVYYLFLCISYVVKPLVSLGYVSYILLTHFTGMFVNKPTQIKCKSCISYSLTSQHLHCLMYLNTPVTIGQIVARWFTCTRAIVQIKTHYSVVTNPSVVTQN